MTDVFISYARDEKDAAARLRNALEQLGLTVFFDLTGIDGGDDFADVIDRVVKTAGTVLGCWSPHALSREWIRTECLIAKQRGVLIPLEMEPLDLMSVPAVFGGMQRISMIGFDGKLDHPGWESLVRAIAKKLEQPELIERAKSLHTSPNAKPGPSGKERGIDTLWQAWTALQASTDIDRIAQFKYHERPVI